MSDKSFEGVKAKMTLKKSTLQKFKEEGGVDPVCYLDIVAMNLLARFGMDALTIATKSIEKMVASGDEDGREIWEGVADCLSSRSAALAPSGGSVH